MATEMALDIDKTTLERLNSEYVDAFMNADVEWYRDNLAKDFVCIESHNVTAAIAYVRANADKYNVDENRK